VVREESGTPTCALNSKLIGMYRRNVLGFMHAHTLYILDITLDMYFGGHFGLSVHHVSVGNPRKSLYMRPQMHNGVCSLKILHL